MRKRPGDLARFAGNFERLYGRKANAGYDPNDRTYSRQLEEALKRLRPEDLENVLRSDVEPKPRPPGRRRR